ncbi:MULTISPECIES: ceramidase domain-containing protein [unclassified Microcoleus]|uniref:ceramidase domain-containing protein n=1 Tax=unclassified Microcoleus TaxID=2642155 RepID=UPI0025DA0A1A|nr:MULTISPECIES: ceramidase domain-containing protein [unclassified Microcoleus]
MNDYIDLYCERIIPGLWSEPLNAVSNISFFIAAWAIFQLTRQQQKVPTGIWILISLATSIGIGSTLFHTFATEWAGLLDMIPIVLFQLVFLWLYSRQVVRMKYGYAGGLLVGFLFASNFSNQFTNVLNGSLSYAPTFLVLLGLGLYHYQQKKREPFVLLAASGVFLLALSFRTVDRAICPYFSTGTHFLWHLCNGILLYLSARALILNRSMME